MTKSELIKKVAEEVSLSQKDTEKVINAVINNIVNAVKSEGEVTLSGFGKFEKVHKDAREARNPATGETIAVAAKNVVKFTAQKAFKDSVQ